jgi:hypothetical protein
VSTADEQCGEEQANGIHAGLGNAGGEVLYLRVLSFRGARTLLSAAGKNRSGQQCPRSL